MIGIYDNIFPASHPNQLRNQRVTSPKRNNDEIITVKWNQTTIELLIILKSNCVNTIYGPVMVL